ncbi:unnamed protein product [Leptidea sinapis]|uniref:Uncharacterized protein n=1 Tax=Leptidea sinapis TaxID=189913 RepID=A0A5E4PJZ1_9NEOP|nr:unnamed protein product [Leptidea sinapis]
MKGTKFQIKLRGVRGEATQIGSPIEETLSSPEFYAQPKLWSHLKKNKDLNFAETVGKSPRENRLLASESDLPTKLEYDPNRLKEQSGQGDDKTLKDINISQSKSCEDNNMSQQKSLCRQKHQTVWKNDKEKGCGHSVNAKKTRSCSPTMMDTDDPLTKQIRDIHNDTRKSVKIIKACRTRLLEIQKKSTIADADVKEIGEKNEVLLREMERFEFLSRTLQKLVGVEVANFKKSQEESLRFSSNLFESPLNGEADFNLPKTNLPGYKGAHCDQPTRSKSEIDLTRKLTESYDMQEKLVADNADLEVKRYMLYKELMTKDQSLEMCRAQIKRLQGELKIINKENSILQGKLNKNNPQGDATAMNQDNNSQQESDVSSQDDGPVCVRNHQELESKLEEYKTFTAEIEKEVSELEFEVRHIRVEMDKMKGAETACRGGGGMNTCFQQPAGAPPVPPLSRACGVCPPCPAPCNPNAPPTPAEREVQKLTIQLHQMEEVFKTKVTECALLRAELLKKKEELEKERCQHREVQNKLRELEMKFEGLNTHTNMLLGTKEEAFETEVNVRALKQCYREAREEIDELRILIKEQNEQIQDYRVKYLHAQQLVEEQRRQMDMMDMDNTRISEQINLEIQRVKLKFQEKLQELAPIPQLLKATQMRLKDAQQSQALAEHNAEQLARELNCAREKIHVLLHNSIKPPEKAPEKGADEKQLGLLQQRITQLTETNMTLKSEIERLKANVIRMEEMVLANEKRLQEKMQECAQLGGELDRIRDEAARALQRANERTDTIRKCMQTTVAELERQLASSRAQVKNAEKEREEVQCRMQCQIKRLNDNFEQAQLRILGLQTQVQTLRRTASSTGDGDTEPQQECECKTFFDEP